MSDRIHILVVDDHPVVRDGLVTILNTQPDFEVVGEASGGQEAIEAVLDKKPDLLLLDLEMPEMDGVAVLRHFQTQSMAVRSIVFTAFDTDERILEAVQAGAQGYLLKGAERQELFNAIRVVHGGGSLLQPVIASKLLQQMSEAKQQVTEVDALTPREAEVLELLAQGLQNKEIANALVISERTVKFHVSSIMGKLGASNRTEAVALAANQGLVRL
jgi:DNA-binding NarL/FixJ family response regulator